MMDKIYQLAGIISAPFLFIAVIRGILYACGVEWSQEVANGVSYMTGLLFMFGFGAFIVNLFPN